MTTTASPVSKQTASAAQETGATGAAATAIETIETGVAGVAGAATNAAANAIEDLEAAESHGFSTRFPLNSAFIFTFGALGGMLFGFDTGIISGASPLIESDFGLSVSQTGFITSSVLIGSCAGALSIGALSDRFGRKKLLIVSALLFLLGSGLCASSTGFAMMVCARIILGLAVGAASALTPAYLAELAPKERRGSLSTLFQLMVTFGILLAYASNLGFLNHNLFGIRDWRWMLGSALVPAALLLLGGLLLPESPRYLVMKGKKAIAEKVLLEVVGDRNASATVEQIAQSLEGETQPKVSDLRGKTFGLKSVVWVGIGVALFQQVSGANVIMFYDSSLWKAVGFTESASMTIAVVRALLATAVTVLGMLIIDKVRSPRHAQGRVPDHGCASGRGGRLLRPIHDDRRWRHRAARCVGHHHDYRRLWVLPDLLRDVGRGDVGRHRRDLPEPHPRRCGGAGHRRQLDRQLPRLHHLPAAA